MKTENPLELFARHPEFLILVVNYLVFKLGGQVSFNAQGLADACADYECKVIQDFEAETVVITSQIRKGHVH